MTNAILQFREHGLLTLQLIFNPGAAFSMGEGFTVGLTVIAAAALGLASLAAGAQTPPSIAPVLARRSGVSSMPATLVGQQRAANGEHP